MTTNIPTAYFFAAGTSEGFTTLNAFDGALMNAGIGNTNLVRMSSICPPRARSIEPVILPQGALIPVAYASITSTVPGQLISAGVAIAFPEDENHAGLIMEYSAIAGRETVDTMVRRMASEGMNMRGKAIKEIQSKSVEVTVDKCGCAFSAVVLWD